MPTSCPIQGLGRADSSSLLRLDIARKIKYDGIFNAITTVKAVRLFLTWSRETRLVDVDALLEQYPVRTGSAARWMSRLDDGSLLSLNPHG